MEVAPFFVDFHHFLSIFTIFLSIVTIFYRFSRFTHFCRDLHFVAIYALFPQIFFGQNSLHRFITRFLHVWSYHALSSSDGFKNKNYWKFSEQALATKIEPLPDQKKINLKKRNNLRLDHIKLAIFNMSIWFGTSGFSNSSSYVLDMQLKPHLFHYRHVHSPTESPLSLLIKDELWSRSNKTNFTTP